MKSNGTGYVSRRSENGSSTGATRHAQLLVGSCTVAYESSPVNTTDIPTVMFLSIRLRAESYAAWDVDLPRRKFVLRVAEMANFTIAFFSSFLLIPSQNVILTTVLAGQPS